MKELTKIDLMLYVERIVRPVSATQGRKLRMRTDLLEHLQFALEEERLRFPGDEESAWEQAKLRLGNPIELTKSLQQTVPLLERTLQGRMALSPAVEQLEQRMATVPGQRGAMTLGHKSILSAMATLAFAQLAVSLLNALASVEMQTVHLALATIGIPLGWFLLLYVSYQFVFTAASGSQHVDRLGTFKRGTVVFAAQIALMFFVFFSVADRLATINEIAVGATASLLTLVLSGLVASCIGQLRRPYDEWLALDIAE